MADDTKHNVEEEELSPSPKSSPEDEDSDLMDALGLGSESSVEEEDTQSVEDEAAGKEAIIGAPAPVDDVASSAAPHREGDEAVAVYDDGELPDLDEDVSEEEIEAAFVGTPPESEASDAEDDDEVVAVYEEKPPLDTLDEDSEEEEDDEFDDSDEFPVPAVIATEDGRADGLAAYFDDPHELLHAAALTRDSDFEVWDAFSPFPIHGIEDAMGIGRSWLPWVTFGAGGTGFLIANALQFGTLTLDWPIIIGGKPHAPWPSFVPIMFELTVLIGGVTSALVMFIASGCFRKPRIIDPEITNDRFVIWIDAKDPHYADARAFLQTLDPVEIRTVTF